MLISFYHFVLSFENFGSTMTQIELGPANLFYALKLFEEMTKKKILVKILGGNFYFVFFFLSCYFAVIL